MTVADPPVILLDTSTAIALLLEDHERHAATMSAVQGRRLGLAGHAWFETYSILTRLPSGLRRSPADAHKLLARDFAESRFLGSAEAAELGQQLVGIGISGGAVYDALVAATAREHELPLLSGDSRARRTYEAMGVKVELVLDTRD
jgi:predicted nucleic acid-binding protein